MANESIVFIYSSDLKRSDDTAAMIAKFHHRAKLILTERMRERYLGELQAKNKESLGLKKEDFVSSVIQPKDGETLEDLYARSQVLAAELYQKHKDKMVLLVGHSSMSKALIAAVIGP